MRILLRGLHYSSLRNRSSSESTELDTLPPLLLVHNPRKDGRNAYAGGAQSCSFLRPLARTGATPRSLLRLGIPLRTPTPAVDQRVQHRTRAKAITCNHLRDVQARRSPILKNNVRITLEGRPGETFVPT